MAAFQPTAEFFIDASRGLHLTSNEVQRFSNMLRSQPGVHVQPHVRQGVANFKEILDPYIEVKEMVNLSTYIYFSLCLHMSDNFSYLKSIKGKLSGRKLPIL